MMVDLDNDYRIIWPEIVVDVPIILQKVGMRMRRRRMMMMMVVVAVRRMMMMMMMMVVVVAVRMMVVPCTNHSHRCRSIINRSTTGCRRRRRTGARWPRPTERCGSTSAPVSRHDHDDEEEEEDERRRGSVEEEEGEEEEG
jgi:hypothetical protein